MDVTAFLPPFLQDFLKQLVGKDCYKTLFQQLQLQHRTCAPLFLSKVIGLGIVAGGSLVKVPQLVKIVRAQSARGLSPLSYGLESLAYGVTLAYNFRMGNPFSTYGEVGFVLVQNWMILFLMGWYANGPGAKRTPLVFPMCLMALGLLTSVVYFLLDPTWVPMGRLTYLQLLTIPITILSRIPQIMTNFKQGSFCILVWKEVSSVSFPLVGSTGQLSAFTIFLYFFGSLARVFTTWQEVNDKVILYGYSIATLLNGILVLQMIMYWNNTSATGKSKKND